MYCTAFVVGAGPLTAQVLGMHLLDPLISARLSQGVADSAILTIILVGVRSIVSIHLST